MYFKFPTASQLSHLIQPLDLVLRGKTLARRFQTSWLAWLVVASAIEAGSAFVPWLSWLLWPLLVWCVVQAAQKKPLRPRLGPLYTLTLYGALNFLIFTGLSEGSRLLPSMAVYFSGAEGSLFPYTFSQATAFLVTAACAERLSTTQDDVLKVLAFSVRDLLTSPLSWLLLVFAYAFPITGLATQMGMQSGQPGVATWVGHGLLGMLGLLWALGADHGTVTNHS
jgi:hypothetical protein